MAPRRPSRERDRDHDEFAEKIDDKLAELAEESEEIDVVKAVPPPTEVPCEPAWLRPTRVNVATKSVNVSIVLESGRVDISG
jgi:hypothetical protein